MREVLRADEAGESVVSRWPARAAWIALAALLLLPLGLIVQRQVGAALLSVAWDTGTFVWEPGVCPAGQTCVIPDAFRVECGAAAGQHTSWSHETPWPDVDLPVSWVVPAPGTYFCVTVAIGTVNGAPAESPPSNEVAFEATAPPPPLPPGDTAAPVIAFGAVLGSGSHRRIVITVSDDIAVTEVDISVNGTARTPIFPNAPWFQIEAPIPMSKTVSVQVTARDAAGNLAAAGRTISR